MMRDQITGLLLLVLLLSSAYQAGAVVGAVESAYKFENGGTYGIYR